MPSYMNPRLWAFSQEAVFLWMLVLTRMTGLFATLPGIGQESLPVRVRAMLAALAAMIIAPVIPRPKAFPTGMPDLLALMVLELAAGALMGLVVGWIIEVVGFAGQLMDIQIGFSFAQVLDPGTSNTAGLTSVLLLQMTLVFIFVSGLHHQMILALVESYRILPIGQGMPDRGLALVPLLGQMLARGLQLAFPVLICLFLVDVLAGVSSKLMPQLQIFQLTFPLKIAVGLLILAYIFREFGAWLTVLLQNAPREALRLIG